MSDAPYLDTRAAAKRLGIAASSMCKMRTYGGGPPFLRLSPRRVVYKTAALDAWACAQEFRSTSDYRPAA